VGSVVLLAILGFELPKVLGGHAETVPAVTTTSPSLVGSSPAVAAGKLPDTDRVVIQRDSNQLLSFGLFKSKDPFVQQLSTNASAPVASPLPAPKPSTAKPRPAASPPLGVGLTPGVTTTPGASTSPSNPPSSSGSPVITPGSTGTTPTATAPATTTPAAPETAPTEALISTNGVCERVAVKATFPADEDIFRVVSIAPGGKSVEIAVVGGSYDSGQPTATLKLGEKLTLVNTADGTRYVIALQSKCNAEAQPTRATPTTPVTTTPVAAAPPTTTATAPTTTTPIVTDSLDTTVPSN
jgi:hypothetical protein